MSKAFWITKNIEDADHFNDKANGFEAMALASYDTNSSVPRAILSAGYRISQAILLASRSDDE